MRIRTYRVVGGTHWFDVRMSLVKHPALCVIEQLGWILFMPDYSDGRWWVIRPLNYDGDARDVDIRIDAHDLNDASDKALEVLGWSKPILISEEEG